MRLRTFTRQSLLAPLLATSLACSTAAFADSGDKGIEQALAAAQQSQKGVTLYVRGVTVAGAVVRIDPGQTVELRSQQFGRIVVRIERIDGVAHP